MTLQHLYIKKFPIRLGQFLKLSEIVLDGIEAKILISDGSIKVNNVEELRRGRQLNEGDIIEIKDDARFQLKLK